MARLGRYELLEQLGSGSMGTVYRGRDTVLDRLVAIKTIRAGTNISSETRERFYREARICARLNHPGIVSIFDLGEEDGIYFIAMELLKGSDFGNLIDSQQDVPLSTKLTAMAQVCEALAHAHREGVIHRDIKPSNLFLQEDGRAKIVDFGIARLPVSDLTKAGTVLGTPNYMSPEQLNNAPLDGRADLFSAAVVFFELLTFRHPFASNLIPRRIQEERPDSLTAWNPSLAPELEAILARAMSKSPEDRFRTGDEFAEELRNVRIPVPLAPPEPAHDRKRLRFALAGLGIGAVLLIIAPIYFRTGRAEPFVATVRVAMPMAHILDRPEEGAKEIASRPRGSEMNVLAMPKSIEDGWVKVQGRDGDGFSRPGYVRAVDLTEWEPKGPDAALALARLSGPMEAGSDSELRTQIEKLNAVSAANPGKPEAAAAALDCARLEFTLVRHGKDGGQPSSDWQSRLAELTNQVEDLRKNPALQAGGDKLLRDIHDLIAGTPGAVIAALPASTSQASVATPVSVTGQSSEPVAGGGQAAVVGSPGGVTVAGGPAPGPGSPLVPPGTPPPSTPPPTDEEIQSILRSAGQLRKDHRYNDARRLALRVLRYQPRNSDAQVLLKKIDAAIELERSAQ